jgi:hypothetical protein
MDVDPEGTGQRLALLRALIELRLEPADALRSLARFGWDIDAPLTEIAAADVVRLLLLFNAGRMSPREVEDWADALEVRDDVGFADRRTQEMLFELANPVLFGGLTHERAVAWIRGAA